MKVGDTWKVVEGNGNKARRFISSSLFVCELL